MKDEEGVRRQMEQAALSATWLPIAANLAAYYGRLVSEGMPPEAAIELTKAMQQTVILNAMAEQRAAKGQQP